MESGQLYIVLSQTGTLLSRILKLVTGAEYNHASISTSSDLEQMYSFARRRPYNPFCGGLVKESPHTGTFKRFSKTKVVILAIEVNMERYTKVCKTLFQMYSRKESYQYDYLGLCLAAFHIRRRKNNCYYCSEFVREVLQKGQVESAEQLPLIVKPIDFLGIPHKQIYQGYLKDYSKSTKT